MKTTAMRGLDLILNPRFPGIHGTEQADILNGTAAADTIYANGGNDTVHGGLGNDLIFGGAGHDTLFGDAGNDTLNGGAHSDTLDGGAGADTLIGGTGTDTVSYANATGSVMVDLTYGGLGNEATGDTYSGIENVTGSAYADLINGNDSANVIDGGLGNDFLRGLGGNDHVLGGNGNDTLLGGQGDDRLNGGFGNDRLTGDDPGVFGRDTFVMLPASGHDTITDFQRGFDKIDLSSYNNPLTGFEAKDLLWSGGHLFNGNLAAYTQAGSNPEPGADSNDYLMFNAADSTLYFMDIWWTNENGIATQNLYATAIATLNGVTSLSADDLVLGELGPGIGFHAAEVLTLA